MEKTNNKSHGWIKLHRKSLDSQVLCNAGLWQLWCYCLLKASHKSAWVSVKTGRGQTSVRLEPGQFIFGRFTAAKELKAAPSTIRARLRKLVEMDNVTVCDRQTTAHFTVLRVCNWGFYQNKKSGDDNHRTGNPEKTDRQPVSENQPADSQEQGFSQLGSHETTTQRTGKPQNRDTYKKVKKYSLSSREYQLAELLDNEIRKRKADYKSVDLQKWAASVDLMVRVDKRDPARIAEVIRWCQQDDFWQNNILSTTTLRKQFDRLELKMGPRTEPIPLQRGADGKTPRERMLEAQNG